jgi:prepilin-type N-terminal cleavage/methylation domain-containing protein
MRRQAGFTLLELLLVVFILSVIALGAVSLVQSSDDQLRFEETQSRLRLLRSAILGESGPAQRLVGGHVADLGTLPDDVESLVRVGSADAFGAVRPEYGGTALDDVDAVRLLKGWRGPYVALGPSTDPSDVPFRDGWGNVALVDDALHHGWSPFDPTSNPFEITSLGSDGLPGGAGDYDRDLTIRVAADDWRVNLADWTVEVTNSSSGDLTLKIAVLVYSAGSWSGVESGNRQVDAGSTEALSFGDKTVPIGRHLAIVVKVNGSGDVPYKISGVGTGESPYVSKRVSFFARRTPESLALEVR